MRRGRACYPGRSGVDSGGCLVIIAIFIASLCITGYAIACVFN